MIIQYERADWGRADLNSLKEVKRNARNICNGSTDQIAMTDKNDSLSRVLLAESFKLQYDTGLYLQHELAARDADPTSK